MTIYDLMKSIGARFMRCHLDIVCWVAISLLLCLIGQGLYMVTAMIASWMPDPFFGYVADAYRVVIFAFAVILIFMGFALFEYRFFRDAYRDARQFFSN